MVSLLRPTPEQLSTLERSRQATRHAFAEVDQQSLLQLSRLTLPEIEEIQEEVARVLPAGNLPAFLLSGLLKLKGRKLTPTQVSQDLTALLKGVELLSRSLYGIFIATPATVLYAYQKLLQLAGKETDSAFPQGTWQFYLEFGLREDSARHVNETVGFYRDLHLQGNQAAAAAAWICAAQTLLYEYDELLAVDWRERVMLHALSAAARASQPPLAPLVQVVRDWNQLRPYHRPAQGGDYLPHRKAMFQQFLHERLSALPQETQTEIHQRFQQRQSAELPAYLEQMTLLATLSPERYQEHKEPLAPWRVMTGFIWRGRTYLLPTCRRDAQGSPLCFPYTETRPPFPLFSAPEGGLCDTHGQVLWIDRSGRVWQPHAPQPLGCLLPPTPDVVLGWVLAIFNTPVAGPPPDLDLLLAETPRAQQASLRAALPPATQSELATLRRAPILINWDQHDAALPLALLRRDHRGIGDHALTLFRTPHSMVFDQSHIFFDGLWGMAISEILTDNARHLYRQLRSATPRQPVTAPQPLGLLSGAKLEPAATRIPREAAAESDTLDGAALQQLRKWLAQRGAVLTVNDLLLLYRGFHAAYYKPSPRAQAALADLRTQRGKEPDVQAALLTVEATLARMQENNPALLIPMDASNVSPKERLFPTTFRNPLTEMLAQYDATHEAYRSYQEQSNPMNWQTFDQARRALLAYLDAFGKLLEALKAVTMRGESFNTATLRLLAHLSPSTQHWLDQIPQHISVLNEIVKGNEVFSNVGRVTCGSTLTRFVSAKDDGVTKELVWGFLTDDTERMRVSLRDFRAHVPRLMALGEESLADLLAQDYLDEYVTGFNRFVARLGTLISVKRET